MWIDWFIDLIWKWQSQGNNVNNACLFLALRTNTACIVIDSIIDLIWCSDKTNIEFELNTPVITYWSYFSDKMQKK